jgi:hypothetical protein
VLHDESEISLLGKLALQLIPLTKYPHDEVLELFEYLIDFF